MWKFLMNFKRLEAHSKVICILAISQGIFSVNLQERIKKNGRQSKKEKESIFVPWVTKMEWISLFFLVIIIIICVYVWVPAAENMSQSECENYSAHCEVSCLKHVHGFQWLNSGHQIGQANTTACRAISSALLFAVFTWRNKTNSHTYQITEKRIIIEDKGECTELGEPRKYTYSLLAIHTVSFLESPVLCINPKDPETWKINTSLEI